MNEWMVQQRESHWMNGAHGVPSSKSIRLIITTTTQPIIWNLDKRKCYKHTYTRTHTHRNKYSAMRMTAGRRVATNKVVIFLFSSYSYCCLYFIFFLFFLLLLRVLLLPSKVARPRKQLLPPHCRTFLLHLSLSRSKTKCRPNNIN